MKTFLILFAVALAIANAKHVYRRDTASHTYKICVAESLLKSCEKMTTEATKSTVKIQCVPARDRMECIKKIKEHEADFAAMDPEDMYVAGNLEDKEFKIFEEIRTYEEPEADFRYEAVAVVPSDLAITAVTQLKGLRSCHTGVGRNVGYKVPLTKLKNMGIINALNDSYLTPRENELKAFSTFFSKACIVGKWSPDATINALWKKRYSNLCDMCENPKKCDYPDEYSGYEGALRCVAHNHGQVAWTKVIFVRKFFGLPVGTTPAKPTKEDPKKFSYLCPDGTKVPITGKPCTWAARPWQGFVSNIAVVSTIDELREKIENLDEVGHKQHAEWLSKVLEIGENNTAKRGSIQTPKEYLQRAKYDDVLAREYGPPFKTIKFCTLSKDETDKCEELSKSAFSRNVRPRFGCVQRNNVDECMETIREGEADVITVDGSLADRAVRHYGLKPILGKEKEVNTTLAPPHLPVQLDQGHFDNKTLWPKTLSPGTLWPHDILTSKHFDPKQYRLPTFSPPGILAPDTLTSKQFDPKQFRLPTVLPKDTLTVDTLASKQFDPKKFHLPTFSPRDTLAADILAAKQFDPKQFRLPTFSPRDTLTADILAAKQFDPKQFRLPTVWPRDILAPNTFASKQFDFKPFRLPTFTPPKLPTLQFRPEIIMPRTFVPRIIY